MRKQPFIPMIEGNGHLRRWWWRSTGDDDDEMMIKWLTLLLPAYHCRQWNSWRIYASPVAKGLNQYSWWHQMSIPTSLHTKYFQLKCAVEMSFQWIQYFCSILNDWYNRNTAKTWPFFKYWFNYKYKFKNFKLFLINVQMSIWMKNINLIFLLGIK